MLSLDCFQLTTPAADIMCRCLARLFRSDCPFVEKVMHAQRCGAQAVVVFDDDPENAENYLEMTSDSKTLHPVIPAAFLLGKNG